MTLRIETQDLAERQLQLTVEVPRDRIEAAMHRAARHLSERTRIAGFRPGKAPYDLILQKLGEEAVFEEALDHLGQEVYKQALADSAVEPIAPGSLEEVVSRDPLILRYTVPLTPEIDLGTYRDIRLDFEEPSVTDEALERVLEDLRQQQALIEPANRPAQMGDVVVLDVHGRLRDGPEGALLDEHGISVLLAPTTDFPVPGVSDQLVGLEAGAEKSLDHVFPDDYSNEALRGKPAVFDIKVQEVKSRLVPEWSDDLAKNLGEFNDLLDLRVKLRQSLLEQATRQSEAAYGDRAVEQTVAVAKVDFPPVLLQEELDGLLRDLDRRLRDQRLTLADYLKIEKKTEEQLRTELEPRARERLVRSLVLGKVVEAEGLAVTPEDIDAEIERMSAPLKERADGLKKLLDTPTSRHRIELDLLTDKAVRRLADIARGRAPEKEIETKKDEGTHA
ncbi:MAG TPA: trigger factor [Anaerolineales bacterium]|nr:trigger factor [Anaerolineales bacterium]